MKDALSVLFEQSAENPYMGFFVICTVCKWKWALSPFFVSAFYKNDIRRKRLSAKYTILEELIRPVVEGLGFEFWGMEYLSLGKDSVLRIFIETDDEKGIDVEDCARVSRQVSSILDVEDPITGEYNLEVSSPGLDRPLFSLAQYQAYIGSIVSLRLRVPFDGRRKFKGQLMGIESEDIVIRVDQEEYLLPIDLIDKANVVPQF